MLDPSRRALTSTPSMTLSSAEETFPARVGVCALTGNAAASTRTPTRHASQKLRMVALLRAVAAGLSRFFAESGRSVSGFAGDRTFVPAAQDEVGEKRQRKEDHDAGDRQEQERREQARNVEAVAGLDDAIGETGAGPRRAGRDLGHHGADQRQAAGDADAAQHGGQRGRQFQMRENLPARGAVELEQVDEVVSTEFSPSVVLASTGKNATIQ